MSGKATHGFPEAQMDRRPARGLRNTLLVVAKGLRPSETQEGCTEPFLPSKGLLLTKTGSTLIMSFACVLKNGCPQVPDGIVMLLDMVWVCMNTYTENK